MRTIKTFSEKTLTQFSIDLTFSENIKGINLAKTADLVEEISVYYPIAPELLLIPRRMKGFIDLGPLGFLDKEKLNRVDIGSNYMLFLSKKYDRFYRELPKLLDVIEIFNKYLEFPDFTKIVMTYVNDFEIPIEPFKFNDYFTIPSFENTLGWSFNYKDISVGFVPYEEISDNLKRKLVFRLRGIDRGNIEFLNFTLESVFSLTHSKISIDRIILEKYLNEAHDILIDRFISLLNESYRTKLGLDIEQLEQ